MCSFRTIMNGSICLLLPMLTSCVAFKKPLCLPQYRVDIPNFEGRYELKMYDPYELQIKQTEDEIVRLSTGIYKISTETLFVCKIDNYIFAETKNPENGLYEISGIERREDGGFNAVIDATDVRLLEKYKVPYEVIEQKSPRHASMVKDLKAKLIVLDNSSLNPQFVLQLLDSLSLRLAFNRIMRFSSSPTFFGASIPGKKVEY